MKRASLILALSILLHLFVIDLTFYVIASGASNSLLAISGYNVLWLSIALVVGSHNYKESSGS